MKSLATLWAELVERTDYERCERPRAARMSLSPLRDLLARLGDPQQGAPAIHVAGSKGKGTTCHFLERALRGAGFRTGLYTSPHLVHWRERIRIDGEPLGDQDLARALERVLAAAGDDATFFDLMTAAAFVAFADAGCDAWVVEVGLGGRLDSTNVLQPLAAAVTSIELEHTDVLGTDLARIAWEKSGIFKPGARLFSALYPEHAGQPVLVERAAEVGEPLHSLPVGARGRDDLPHPQPHMQRNFALARAILRGLAERETRYAAAAAKLDSLPAAEFVVLGRWEQRLDSQGRTVILDVAHTAGSLAAALEAFRREYPDLRRGVVLGLRQEKDPAELAAALGVPPAGEQWWATLAGDHPMSADPNRIARAFEAHVLSVPGLPDDADVLLVTGSTYLVGAIRPQTFPVSAASQPSAARRSN